MFASQLIASQSEQMSRSPPDVQLSKRPRVALRLVRPKGTTFETIVILTSGTGLSSARLATTAAAMMGPPEKSELVALGALHIPGAGSMSPASALMKRATPPTDASTARHAAPARSDESIMFDGPKHTEWNAKLNTVARTFPAASLTATTPRFGSMVVEEMPGSSPARRLTVAPRSCAMPMSIAAGCSACSA
eukprot:Amastigsp_a175493_95.p3 type:complete len:192 gc:universal Amastigsp_a175493_95:1135-560(-)